MKQKLPERTFLFLYKIAFDSPWRRWFSLVVLATVFFALALQAHAGVVFTTHNSTNGDDDSYPNPGLVEGSDGNFYGTTDGGGNPSLGGPGTIFQISAKDVLTTLYSFGYSDSGAAIFPYAGLVQGRDGYFYGTAFNLGDGTVFRISTNGVLTNLYHFIGGDGWGPMAGLVQASDGYFYGTTAYGGTNGTGDSYGTVFKISTNGAFTSLYSFTGGNDGAYPQAALAQGSDGYFYGTTVQGGAYGSDGGSGTLFKISTNGALTSLYSFTGYVDGALPQADLVQGADGSFYGTTLAGGTNGAGTVFKMGTNGALTSLYSFTGSNDGAAPSGLARASDGYFYGTTAFGQINGEGNGTIFKVSTNGALTTLYSFIGAIGSGNLHNAGIVQGSDGSFYGTTYYGGQAGVGTIFRLTIVPELQAAALTNSLLSLTWSTEAGGSYQLQYASDLTSKNWANFGDTVIATNSTLATTDSVTNTPQRFYRLAIMQQGF